MLVAIRFTSNLSTAGKGNTSASFKSFRYCRNTRSVICVTVMAVWGVGFRSASAGEFPAFARKGLYFFKAFIGSSLFSRVASGRWVTRPGP